MKPNERSPKRNAKRRRPAPKWIRCPLEPTEEILNSMAEATFLSDRSNLEMHRRFNGLISALQQATESRRQRGRAR